MRMFPTNTAAASILLGSLLAAPAFPAATQQTRPVPPENATKKRVESAAPAPAAQVEPAKPFQLNADQTRRQLNSILRQYPPSLDDIFRMDPSLLTNRDYLAMYPTLRDFLNEHPEIAHNPSYFVGEFHENNRESDSYKMWRDVTEGISIITVALTIISLLAWLIKTAVDYRRWLRISRIQEDVHSRLMDRLTTNEDLLAYIQTPAGQQFLQSTPIQTQIGPPSIGAPLGRILWSAQVGLVLAFGGLGLYYAFSRLTPDRATEPFFVISILALSVGVGFIVSSAVAFAFSQRLGLLDNLTRPPNPNKQASTQP